MRRLLFSTYLLFVSIYSIAQIDFTPWSNIEIEAHAQRVCIGDVNNDGLDDVVLGTARNSTTGTCRMFVFIQNLQGNLNDPMEYYYEEDVQGIQSMDIVDVNNDGRNDVIIGYGLGLGIFYQKTNGELEDLHNFSLGGKYGRGAACGDLNNDGLTDIAVTTYSILDSVYVFYQTTTGFLTTLYHKPNIPGGSCKALLIEDLNGDDLKDLVLLNTKDDGVIYIFMQDSLGVLDVAEEYWYQNTGLGWSWDVAAGDINNDNKIDLVTSIYGNDEKIALWFQDTITNKLSIPPIEVNATSNPQPLVICDLNCDNRNEIIVAHQGAISVYEQDSSGYYNSYQKFYTSYQTHHFHDSFSIGDINNDGANDIAVANQFKGLILLYNKSTPTYFETDSTYTHKDTISVNDELITSDYITTNIYNNNEYSITQIDSFFIFKLFREYNIRYDTVIIKTGELCLEQYFDTIIITNNYNIINLINSDTIHIASYKDSVNLIQDIIIYPNPTKGRVTIELPSPYDKSQLDISIYNNWGQLVRYESNTEKSNVRQLFMSDLAYGVYYVSLAFGQSEILYEKIIKTR